MAEELIAFIQAVCVVFAGWGGVLCFRCSRESSAPRHMFDESGPVQSRLDEDGARCTPDRRPGGPGAAAARQA
jgi:hypothetical protein